MPYAQTKWSLAPLYPACDSPELQNAFDMIEEQVAAFEGARGKLTPDISNEQFMQILRAREEIERAANKLYSFAGLSFAADTQDQTAQTLQARAQQFLAGIENRALFFSLWWKGLDEANAKRLAEASGGYRYYLEALRLFKPHTLTEAEEKIVNTKNVTGATALINLYDSMTNRYAFKLRVDGKTREMTESELYSFRYSPDPKMRAKSYQEQLRVFGNDGAILGQMYQTRVRDWRNEYIEMRKFSSPIAARNLMNDIPDEAVDVLLNAARQNVSIFQRYFKLKARHAGMKKLRRYDIYAPVACSKKTYDFDDAANMVL
ncbi:MAG: M3 family metallopeptidase, partial [Chloroflexi bacterium]|nr:M3 family metallopeptidase [Chloroflexota bacterium]